MLSFDCLCAGPDTWCKQFPIAAGKSQSPVDIKRTLCTEDAALKPIVVDYAAVEVGEVGNTGSSWKAQITGGKSSTCQEVASGYQIFLILSIGIAFSACSTITGD